MKRPHAATLAAALACALLWAPAAQASFGVSRFDVSFEEEGGGYVSEAGAHPDIMRTQISFNYSGEGAEAVPDGDIQNFAIAQIPGLVADTTAIEPCSTADFLSTEGGGCPLAAKVGEVNLVLNTPTNTEKVAVYDVAPPPGTLLRLGFKGVGLVPVVVDVGLAGPPDYEGLALTRFAHQTLKVFGVNLTLWGIPGDPVHGTGAPERPFLTLPSSCLGPQLTSYEALSWPSVASGSFAPIPPQADSGAVLSHDQGSPPAPAGFHGCGQLGFSPTIEAAPTTSSAQSPSGLDFSLDVSDPGLSSPKGRAGSEVRKTVVTLPEGMSANPSLAEGLGACSEAELARESASSAPGEGCPQASKIGAATVHSPLIEEALQGSIYVAEPYANPFHTLLALYIVVKSPKLGVVVRQAVKVEPTDKGRLVATAEDIPQLPFSSFEVHLREGGRSPLISPPECGPHAVGATLTPWAGGPDVSEAASFQIDSGPNGSACPSGSLPFSPGFAAGSANNAAGRYSPFDMRLTRGDAEQDITRLSATLPPGVAGRIAGLGRCRMPRSPSPARAAARTAPAKRSSTPPAHPTRGSARSAAAPGWAPSSPTSTARCIWPARGAARRSRSSRSSPPSPAPSTPAPWSCARRSPSTPARGKCGSTTSASDPCPTCSRASR